MEGVLGIFQSISAANPIDLNIYIKALNEHQCLRFNITSTTDPCVQHITTLLSRPTSRHEALLLLQSLLKQCSLDIIAQKGILWVTLCIKACSQKGEGASISLAYDALSILLQKSTEIPELSKSFSSVQISKISESFINVPPAGHLSSLKCLEICLNMYPGACGGNSKTIIQRYLSNFVDSTDPNLVIWSAKCMHLLQQVRGGGIQGSSHKTAWQNYQINLLGSLHQILDSLYANCTEYYDGDIEREPLNINPLDLSIEPVQRASQLNIRFKNLLIYLIIAIREPFPVCKAFLPKKILNLICRGLSVNSTMLQKNPIADNIAIGLLLPDIHIQLFKLAETLIITLNSHLSIYYEEILSFIAATLKWTSLGKSEGFQKPYEGLRVAAYNMLSLWSSTMKYGSCLESIYENIVNEIINDITPFQNELTLKVLSGAKKYISKKARRQLHKIQNDKSHLAQIHSKSFDPNTSKIVYSDHDNHSICTAALRSLNYALLYSASFLKPVVLKELQEKIILIGLQCNELCRIKQKTNLYSNYLCRQELYNVLKTLVLSPHHLCPPPTQLVIELFLQAQSNDLNPSIRDTCANHLRILEKLLHPQKESLYFPIDLTEIKNHFKSLNTKMLNNNENSMNFSDDEDDIVDQNRSFSDCDDSSGISEIAVEQQNLEKQNIDQHTVEEVEEHIGKLNTKEALEHNIKNPKRNSQNISREDNSCVEINLNQNKKKIRLDENVEMEVLLIESDDEENIQKSDEIAEKIQADEENEILEEKCNLDDDDIVNQFAAEFVNELQIII